MLVLEGPERGVLISMAKHLPHATPDNLDQWRMTFRVLLDEDSSANTASLQVCLTGYLGNAESLFVDPVILQGCLEDGRTCRIEYYAETRRGWLFVDGDV